MNGFAYTRIRDVCSENLRSHEVTKVEFSQDGATLVSSNYNETISWDVATGARKDKVAGEHLAFLAGIGTKAVIGRYIVNDDLVFVYHTRVGERECVVYYT